MRRLFVSSSLVFRVIRLLMMMTLGALSIVGSGGGDDITGGGVTLTSITVTPAAVPDGLPVDLTLQFTAIAEYSNNTQQDVTGSVAWDSSDTNVATISVVGLATGVAVGSTNITASISGVTSNSVSLEVITFNLTKIEIAPAIMPDNLPLGIDQQFVALGTFDNNRSYNITEFVAWNSVNPTAVIMDSNVKGLATSEAVGTANITATTTTPLLTSNSVSVEVVNNKTADNLIVEPQWIGSLPVSRTQRLNALLQFSDNSTYLVTDRVAWSSDDEATAVVNNDSNFGAKGLVTAVSTGGATSRRVTIRAVDNLTSPTTATIDVTNSTINSITIGTRSDDGINSLPVGYSRDFYARGEFSDGSKLNLINPGSWTISDPTIASFISAGATVTVRGLAPGTVTISYVDILADGSKSGEVGMISLTITDASLTAVTVTPASTVMPVEAYVEFLAQGTFAGGLLRDITYDVVWDSTVDTVAVFGPDRGKLTSLTTGSTNVTATGLNSSGSPVVSTPVVSVAVQNETIQTLQITDLGVALAGDERDYTAVAGFTGSVTADYTDRVLWSTSDVEIATVSNVPGSKGQVTFIKAGQVNLNATVPGTTISATPLTINVQ